MAGRMEGKRALVTGAAQGLGEAMARAFAAAGALVTLPDVNLDGAEAVAGRINTVHGAGTAFARRHDVTVEADWDAAVSGAASDMGGLSVLVNNAGMSVGGDLDTLELDDFRRVMSVNVDSVFLGCKHAVRVMKDHQPGSIVNISSIAGLIASHNSPAYNASKAAVWLLSKCVALYCAHRGWDIRSNSIHPTFVDTPILDPLRRRFGKEEAEAKLSRQIPLKRLGRPEEIAAAAVYLASDESRFVTASELKLDGGISAM